MHCIWDIVSLLQTFPLLKPDKSEVLFIQTYSDLTRTQPTSELLKVLISFDSEISSKLLFTVTIIIRVHQFPTQSTAKGLMLI